MSEPPTILIRDSDDDGTLIDRRFSGPVAEVREPSVRRHRIIEASVVLALIFGLGSVAYRQERAADALRHAIEDMKARKSAPFDLLGSNGRGLASVDIEPLLDATTYDVTTSDRQELERQGANLIMSNDFLDALAHYQTLTKLFPKEAVFRDVVVVLRAKLRCAEPASGLCP